jgi:hypothetical protein
MQSKFIAEILHLQLEGKCTVEFFDSIITNETPFNEVIDMHFIGAFGPMAISQVEHSGILVYLIIQDDSILGTPEAKENFLKYVSSFRLAVKSFELFLWLIKDSSVFVIKTMGVAAQSKDQAGHGLTTFSSMFSNSSGEFCPTVFTKEEINRCFDIATKVFEICPTFKTEFSSRVIDYEVDDNRIEKSLKFVKAARGAEFLRAKLTMYMCALECLFSGQGGGELMFKISLRTAYYIGKDRSDRVFISDAIVDAYEIRSKYLHGGEPKPKKKSKNVLIELSKHIDAIVRKALTKVILEDSDKFLTDKFTGEEKDRREKEFEKFLKDLTYPENI